LAGESVFDTATVTVAPPAFTPTGTVIYTFTGTNGTSLAGLTAPPSWTVSADKLTWTETVTLTATGTVPNSDPTGSLPVGSYQFTAAYSGDPNYTGSTSPVESLTIQTAVPALTWGFWKNHTGYDAPVDAWPVGTFIIGTGPNAVTYFGAKTTVNGKTVVDLSTFMIIGGVKYSFRDLQTILGQSVAGNGVINLGHQLIAAILNVANGAGTPTAVSEIQQASDLLAANHLVMGVSVVTSTSNPTLYNELVTLSAELDAFNSSGT
jgi:hypothetical protein